jgi:hypothetical protein
LRAGVLFVAGSPGASQGDADEALEGARFTVERVAAVVDV